MFELHIFNVLSQNDNDRSQVFFEIWHEITRRVFSIHALFQFGMGKPNDGTVFGHFCLK